ncbi:MAG: right-handed parallel beta-helix repeat-containing protein [Oscillospiraceae bacterium]|jgi:hypothetical protein|nr:right-handed parallel beta-helix repeat-containing protein [Oscillospiraceae bacterium]
MQIYVSASARRNGTGSKEAPFQTISRAADIARPGDEVIVAPGVYREWVNPKNGGSSDDCRIIYRSEVKGQAVISGAEPVKNWKNYTGGVWLARVPNGLFGAYNPYTDLVRGDWYMPVRPVHTGEIYLNGKAMYETPALDAVLTPTIDKNSWDPDFTVYKWFTEQDGDFTVIYANFHEADPNRENVEINVRKYCFYPEKPGLNHITLSGFTVKQAATQWAPPTAYQEGMVGPHWSKGWIIEDCEVSDSRCSGISLGKYLQPNNENKWSNKRFKDGTQTERDAICQAQREGWTKEKIGSHIVRRCEIHDCGQTGIVGHLGGVFSIIEDNHIHHINNKQDLFGAEIAGIKMHAAIDVIFRRNHIHHCTRGLWLDWQAQGTRVTQNLFHDNVPPAGTELFTSFQVGEDVFVEVSHGPTLIDNNLLLSNCAMRLSTQGFALVHNLIAGSFTFVGRGTDNGAVTLPSPRYTPYHMHHRTELAGFMTFLHGDARFYNNVFVQKPIREDLERVRQADLERAKGRSPDKTPEPNFVCGTKPYDGYPTVEEYFSKFYPDGDRPASPSSDKYYEHLPVHTGGNVYFNGAQPCDKEKNYLEYKNHEINLNFIENNGRYMLETNLYDFLPDFETQLVSTELLGEAFEPEQKFENPDGSPILFNQDYFGAHRAINPFAGPLENADELKSPLAEH